MTDISTLYQLSGVNDNFTLTHRCQYFQQSHIMNNGIVIYHYLKIIKTAGGSVDLEVIEPL